MNGSNKVFAVAIVSLLSGFSSSAVAVNAEKLDGWKKFHFMDSIKEVEKKLESMHDDQLKAKTGEGFEAPYSTYVLKQNIIDGYMVQFHYNENKKLVWVKLGYSLDGDEDGEERYREDKCNNTYEEAKNKITSKYGKYNAGGPKNRKSYMWSDKKQWIFQNGNVIALRAQNVRNVEECSIKVNYYHSSIMEKEENDF